ncbi:MAG: hypothetical protein JST00_47795 [Deltaproteobacteria bacterium]|nr:hypothetical protein [Deltaproteobacteria bacterium]
MRSKSLVGAFLVAAVFVGFANVGAQCNEDGGGRTGFECDRDPDRTDVTYGFMGRKGYNGCAVGYRCFAQVGEVRGRCSPGVGSDECAPPAPPYANGYSATPSPECPADQLCELRGAPPVSNAYIGHCRVIAPPPDGGPVPAPVVLTCGMPVPDTFTHVEGRAIDYQIKDCDLEIGKPVVVAPGTVIAIGEGRSIRVGKNGSFQAVGTAEKRIVLRSLGAPRWGSVIFFSKSPANELAFVDIAQAGVALPEGHAAVIVGAGSFAGGDVSIRDCVFGGSDGDDISVGDGGDLRGVQRSTFDSLGYPISLTPHMVDRFAADNVVRSSKRFVNVRADGAPVARDLTWAKLSVPYHVTGTVEILGSHTIAKGVSIVMGAEANIRVDASAKPSEVGKLVMSGTAAEKIDIRGEAGAGAGSWGSIHIQTGAANSMQFVVVNGGGGLGAPGDPKGMVWLDPNLSGTAVSIRDCVFEASKSWAVVVNGQTVNGDIETANTFTNNASGGVSP